MEKRINNKIDNWTNTFKDDLRDYIVQNKVELFNGGADNQLEKLIGFVYKYGSLSLSNDDFMKRKRVKNTVPYFERCKAKRASGEQCTRRRKTDEGDSCMFCGTHIKGTPHGVVTSSEENVESICRSAHNISDNNYNNEVNLVSKKPKKIGFFEKLFNLFK